MAFWQVLFQNQSLNCLTQTAHPALPLQRYLYPELLGHFLPVLDVPRLFRYALDFSYADGNSLADAGGKAMGILYFYWLARPDGFYWTAPVVPQFNVAFWSISLVLNLLMLLIVIRLGLHHRNVRNVMGGAAGADGLYKAVITILIESFSLYAVNFLLYTGPWIAGNFAQYIFLPILSQTQVCFASPTKQISNHGGEQVIAPFLIVLRVANRTAVTSEAVASGNIGSIRFRSQRESTDGIVTLPDGGPVGSVSTNGDNSGEFGGGIETGIEEVPL